MLKDVRLLDTNHVIPSAATYNTLARLLKFIDCDTGNLLFAVNAQGGLRLSVLGGGGIGGSSAETYDGPYALTVDNGQLRVNAGWLNRNGEFRSVGGATLPLRAGTVCVTTTLDETTGTWSNPAIAYGTPGLYSYPIGHVRQSGASYSATSYRVPVAIFLATAECPVSMSYET